MGKEAEKTTQYFPDKAVREGYITLIGDMLRELFASKWLTLQFFKRNYSALYKQSVLGILWAMVIPLISAGTFIFLNRGGILNVGEITVPYPLFAVAGTAMWQVFSVGLVLGTNSLVSAGAMISKINFPRESLVISSVIQGIIPSLVQIVLVLLLIIYYQVSWHLAMLLVPLALIPLLLLTLGLGFIFSLINGVVRDVGNGLSAVVTFLMFFTPVLYAKPADGMVAFVSKYNPIYYLIAVPRDLLTTGATNDVTGYLYSVVFSIVVFFMCWIAFHLAETRIPERI